MNVKRKYDVIAELKKIKSLNPLCVFGNEEDTDDIKPFSQSGVKMKILPGSHHYNDDYQAVSGIIIKDLPPEK